MIWRRRRAESSRCPLEGSMFQASWVSNRPKPPSSGWGSKCVIAVSRGDWFLSGQDESGRVSTREQRGGRRGACARRESRKVSAGEREAKALKAAAAAESSRVFYTPSSLPLLCERVFYPAAAAGRQPAFTSPVTFVSKQKNYLWPNCSV